MSLLKQLTENYNDSQTKGKKTFTDFSEFTTAANQNDLDVLKPEGVSVEMYYAIDSDSNVFGHFDKSSNDGVLYTSSSKYDADYNTQIDIEDQVDLDD